jgi:dolichol-phosphate mannosyltransferase
MAMQEFATTWPIGSPAMRVLVMLPTYNEIENIQDVLERARAALPDADILVIDDGSPDGTADRAEKIGEVLGGVDVLRRAQKSGLGSAYRAGFRVGLSRGYDVMIEMDADLSHDPADVPRLIEAARDADLVLGSRYVDGGAIANWGPVRRFVSAGGSLYARLVLGVPVHDLTGGFKCFRREVLEVLDLHAIASRGYAFQIETTYRALRAGFRVVEVPIRFVDREHGGSKMSRSIFAEAVWKVPVLRLRALTGRL